MNRPMIGFVGERRLPQGLGVQAIMLGGRCEAHYRTEKPMQSERCAQTALYVWEREGKASVAYCAACAQSTFPEVFAGGAA